MLARNNSHRRCFVPLLVFVVLLWHAFSSGQQADRNSDPSPEAPKPSIAESWGSFARWGEFYREDWSGTAASSPAPQRRGPPSPLNSPPFPNSDWPYGGAPDIGAPDTNVPPLMQALYTGPNGNAWEDSRVKLYGWLEGSLNLST